MSLVVTCDCLRSMTISNYHTTVKWINDTYFKWKIFLYPRYKLSFIIVSLSVQTVPLQTLSPPSQGLLLANCGHIWEEDQDPTEQNTHTHTFRQTHVRAWKSAWEREKWESETESDTLTLPLILFRCVGSGQSKCLPSTHGGSFQSAFNPIIKLVMLPWTHSPLAGECAHAGLTNSNYVCGLLTLCEHI